MKREYPSHPIVGVGGVVIRGSCVLLIQRGTEPLKGEWSIPGGMLELGESLADGVRREVLEETGLRVRPLESIAVVDRVQKNGSRVRYHYVIIDYVCRSSGGQLKPGSDVLDARWVERKDISRYKITPKATAVIADAFEWVRRRQRPKRSHR
ncbi:MAG: NUDIX domain-containing protein [Acidobacteria bacterium]|nr:MAG: NUDIX domain-containing protein [Acidobacteriota bacterium]